MVLGAFAAPAQSSEESKDFEGNKQSFDYLLYLFQHDKDIGIKYDYLASMYRNHIPNGLVKQFLKRKKPSNYEGSYFTKSLKIANDSFYALNYESPCYNQSMCRVGYLSTLDKSGELISDIVFSYDSSTAYTLDTMRSRIVQQSLIEQVIKRIRFKGEGRHHQFIKSDTTLYRYFALSLSGVIEPLKERSNHGYRQYPFTARRLVQPHEMRDMSTRNLNIMQKEIFADYGRQFEVERWQAYFKKKPWYDPKEGRVYQDMSLIDQMNLKRILRFQRGNER